jgi:hypothetical protein
MVVSSAQPCTFFMSTLKGNTYFGNNEDFSDQKTNIWFIPTQNGKFGYMYFSYDNGWPQGGMNDQGLCFDGASTPRVSLTFAVDKKSFRGYLPDKIMGECRTVEDVVAMVKEYRFSGLRGQGQLLFTDKTGDAVILGGPDKDDDLDIIRKDRDIMVLTNFFPHHPDMGGFPCLRFQSATHHLEQNPQPSVDNFRRILETVSSKYTQYSNIFDLNNQVIWLYHQRDFTKTIELRLQDELDKGSHAYRIHHLFGEPREGEGLDEINKLRKEGRISRRIPRFVAYQ